MTGLGFDDGGNQAFVDVLLGDGDGGFAPDAPYPGADGATNGRACRSATSTRTATSTRSPATRSSRRSRCWPATGRAGSASVEVTTPGEPLDTALGDIDGDGHLDVVSVQLGRGAAVVHFGDGDGGFAESHDIDSGGLTAYRVAVGDLDDDGRDDVVTGTSGPTATRRWSACRSTACAAASTVEPRAPSGRL